MACSQSLFVIVAGALRRPQRGWMKVAGVVLGVHDALLFGQLPSLTFRHVGSTTGVGVLVDGAASVAPCLAPRGLPCGRSSTPARAISFAI